MTREYLETLCMTELMPDYKLVSAKVAASRHISH